jgi:dephospho-CoA kinase
MHPIIGRGIRERLAGLKRGLAFVVVPLLLESKTDNMYDIIWTVSASEDIRIKRLVERDNITVAQAQSILRAQTADEIREKRADIVFVNNGGTKELIERVDAEYNILKAAAGE